MAASLTRGIATALSLQLLMLSACGALADDADAQQTTDACDKHQAGLLITEVMANPHGPDGGREWLEIYNAGTRPLCLNNSVLHLGLPWAPKARTLKNIGCMPPQALWVLAHGAAQAGPAPPYDVHHRYGALAMPNQAGTVAISCEDTVLDAMEYGTGDVPAPQSGRALARVPMTPGGQFCLVTGEADALGDIGSPGLENPGCNTCRDDTGRLRPVQAAPPGGLEFVAWEHAHDVRDDERVPWGRVHLRAQGRGFDLAGLTLLGMQEGRPARRWQVPEGVCHALQPYGQVAMPVAHSRLKDSTQPQWLGVKPVSFTPSHRWLVLQGNTTVADFETPGQSSRKRSLGRTPPAP